MWPNAQKTPYPSGGNVECYLMNHWRTHCAVPRTFSAQVYLSSTKTCLIVWNIARTMTSTNYNRSNSHHKASGFHQNKLSLSMIASPSPSPPPQVCINSRLPASRTQTRSAKEIAHTHILNFAPPTPTLTISCRHLPRPGRWWAEQPGFPPAHHQSSHSSQRPAPRPSSWA